MNLVIHNTLGFKCIRGVLIASHTQALTPPTGRFMVIACGARNVLFYTHITQASVFFSFDRAVTFPIVTSATDFPSGTLAEAERASPKICVIYTVIFDIHVPDAHGTRGKP